MADMEKVFIECDKWVRENAVGTVVFEIGSDTYHARGVRASKNGLEILDGSHTWGKPYWNTAETINGSIDERSKRTMTISEIKSYENKDTGGWGNPWLFRRSTVDPVLRLWHSKVKTRLIEAFELEKSLEDFKA